MLYYLVQNDDKAFMSINNFFSHEIKTIKLLYHNNTHAESKQQLFE